MPTRRKCNGSQIGDNLAGGVAPHVAQPGKSPPQRRQFAGQTPNAKGAGAGAGAAGERSVPKGRRHADPGEHLLGAAAEVASNPCSPAGRKHFSPASHQAGSSLGGSAGLGLTASANSPQCSPTRQLRPHRARVEDNLRGSAIAVSEQATSCGPSQVRYRSRVHEADSVRLLFGCESGDANLPLSSPYERPTVQPQAGQSPTPAAGRGNTIFTPPSRKKVDQELGKPQDQATDVIFPRVSSAPCLSQGNTAKQNGVKKLQCWDFWPASSEEAVVSVDVARGVDGTPCVQEDVFASPGVHSPEVHLSARSALAAAVGLQIKENAI